MLEEEEEEEEEGKTSEKCLLHSLWIPEQDCDIMLHVYAPPLSR